MYIRLILHMCIIKKKFNFTRARYPDRKLAEIATSTCKKNYNSLCQSLYRALYGRPYMQTTIKQEKKKKFMSKLDSIRCQKTKPDTRNLKTT